jgi:ferritin-like metal-binding protein YciE
MKLVLSQKEPSMEIDSLKKLYVEQLKDVFSAEKQLVQALPKMAKGSTHPQLRAAFEQHLEQTREHVARLEKVFELIEKPARAKKCKAMEGLIEEGKEVLEEDMEDDVRDAALIAAAQRVEHYEIAAYGTLRTYANLLGETQAVKILQTTLDEEGDTDKKLTQLAESSINVEAMVGA